MRMAEDVEIISSESNNNHADDGAEVIQQPCISDRNGVSSTESTSDCIIDVVSTGDGQPVNVVSSISDPPHGRAASSADQEKPCNRLRQELTSPKASSSHGHRSSPCSTTSLTEAKAGKVSASCELVVVEQGSSKCNSDCDDCDIIVDDSPAPCTSGKHIVSRKRSKSGACAAQIVRPFTDTPSVVCLSQVHRLSRSTTPSPSVSRFTPGGSPGTPRQRSGSLNGTMMTSPSPRPANRGTPGERQRAGSAGELDMKEKNGYSELRHGIHIVDTLDILQLPRPRNPGGVLPQNGIGADNMENEALDLIISPRQTLKQSSTALSMSTSSFPSFLPSENIVTTAAMPSSSTSSSYLISNIIQTTPKKPTKPLVNHVSSLSTTFPPQGTIRGWSSTINESVERPQPSSVVDSEGVAKKIARLDDQNLLPTSVESLWSSRMNNSQSTNFRNVRTMAVRTPPERPKPPRRLSPMLDNMDVSGDRFISPSRRRRISPIVHHGTNSGSGRSTPQSFGKVLKCTLCDYTTHDKVHYRRHRRLHHRNAGNSLFRCGKCSYSTSLARKIKDHYQQMHPEEANPDMLSEFSDSNMLMSTQRYIGARNYGTEPVSTFPGPYYDNNPLDPLLLGRNERMGYPFISPGRQSSLNYPIDQYNVPFGDIRNRQDDQLASNYLRSIVTSIINSESNSRQPPSSTVTSSSFFIPSGGGHHQTMDPCNSHDTCRHPNCAVASTEVKVKVEPDTDAVSDISSTANSCNTVTPDISRQGDNHSLMETNGSHQNGNANSSFDTHRINRHRSLDSSLLHPASATNDTPTDLTSPRQGLSRMGSRALSELTPSITSDNQNQGTPRGRTSDSALSCTIVKSDTTTRGVQCVLPLIKSEINLDGDYFDYLGRQRFSFRGVDRAVQCNLFPSTSTPTTTTRSQNPQLANRTQSVSESELSEHHSSVSGESRCEHCGIAFEDEVIFSIHIGCHSHTDPFKCNVCGKQCGNKYAFYSHIMRGHQF